jgi:hypothetical protein
MKRLRFWPIVRTFLLVWSSLAMFSSARGQDAKPNSHQAATRHDDVDHEQQGSEWFLRGRLVPGKSGADLRHRAYQAKMQARADRLARFRPAHPSMPLSDQSQQSNGGWVSLGPLPLASDATGDGFQNYNQVSGRATAVAIDPADPSGNTLYIGGAQGGVWSSTNAAGSTATNVTWTALTDDQATLSTGAIAIQPGNTNPANSVIVVGTGEADNSADSYFGLGMLVSTNAGSTWTLVPTANSGSLSFAGLGATRMAFSTANNDTVVAAMAVSNVGEVDGAVTANTYPGLYTSTDAGQTWNYDALNSGGAAEAASATSVVYNAAAGLFFAAVSYQGFFSSPDGLNWALLTNQPGAPGTLSAAACPQNYVTTCPIYRGEIAVVPGRNEMYVWFVSADANGDPVDQGIWQTFNGGASWTEISDSGIIDCGDIDGCGVEQGFYNLALLAVPNCPNGAETCAGNPTDLYAGAINLYKCSISSINPTCTNNPFMNLTHAYGCDPLGAPAHVHPDQHALGFIIPTAGAENGADLMYFANDGGIYRALNGFTGLTTGSCSGTNLFDDLNQNLGPITQFVSFSQSASNVNTLLGGTQDNGSPATPSATTSTSWGNVLSGDGGYNAIDPNTGNFFASNPDTGFGSLGIQECSSGTNCNDSLFDVVISSSSVGGDDGAFYFPYVLDPQSSTTLLLGTCRVWSGPRMGGTFTLLSPNFDTLGTGTCTGTEVNTVRSLAAGGVANGSGSEVIYATTDGPGPNNLGAPIGGNVWVTTNAQAVSGVSSTFTNITMNGPGGTSINPNQFPISDAAIDSSDTTGNTAYVTVMGFTGGPGHVWQTTNAGASWIDFTGTAPNNLPDSPTNAVVIDPSPNNHVIYVGTDVGVFESPTTFPPVWTEVGPYPSGSTFGFLPDVAVTALALFESGGQPPSQKLLRASTYGRGVWQFNLLATPDFNIAITNTPLTVFAGYTGTLNGTLTSVNGYNNSVELSCTSGATSPPNPCTPTFTSLTPTPTGAEFQVTTGASAVADYEFNVQGAGSDPNNTTHTAAATLHVVSLALSAPSPGSVTEKHGEPSPAVSFQVSVQGTFIESVTLGCGFSPPVTGASCAFSPGATVNPTASSPVNMSVVVTVPLNTPVGPYIVTLQPSTVNGPAPTTASFTLNVILNPNFVLSEPSPFPEVNAGSTGTNGPITVSSQDGFNGSVNLSCTSSAGPNACSIAPSSVSVFPASAALTINGTSFSAGAYQVTVQGTSGSTTNTFPVSFDVGDYTISGTQSFSVAPAGQATANLTLTSTFGYSGEINAICDTSALSGTQCTLSVQGSAINSFDPIVLGNGATVSLNAAFNVPNNANPGVYKIYIETQDTTGAPSHTWTITMTVGQDFIIGALTPATQTVTAGESASYNFNVLPVGTSFNNSVTLSCSGAPAPCSFSPPSVTPGSSSAAVVLTVNTIASSSSLAPSKLDPLRFFYALGTLPLIGISGVRKRMRRTGCSLATSLLVLFALATFNSCGGGGSNGGSSGGGTGTGPQQQGTVPGNYGITVTGTSGSLESHSPSPVTLVVTTQ